MTNFLKPQKKSFPWKIPVPLWRPQEIKPSADENLQIILKATDNPDDLIFHRIKDETQTFAVVIYLETLVDSNLLGQHVIEPVNKFLRRKPGRSPKTSWNQSCQPPNWLKLTIYIML